MEKPGEQEDNDGLSHLSLSSTVCADANPRIHIVFIKRLWQNVLLYRSQLVRSIRSFGVEIIVIIKWNDIH